MKPDQELAFEMALAAYRDKDMAMARRLVYDILRRDDHMVEAWLLLSYIEENWHDQMQCARNAQAADPASEDARQRVAQLQEARLPDSHQVRAHSTIPALQEVHDDAMTAYFQQSMMEAVDDPLDDPHQCPYCGAGNAPADRTCRQCGESLMQLRPPDKDASPPLRMARVLSFAAVVMAILQLFPVLLWRWYGLVDDGTRLKFALDIIFDQQAARIVLADFTQTLTPALFIALLATGIARIALLILEAAGLQLRWNPAYYGGLLLYGGEIVYALLAMVLGWSGVLAGGLAALVSLGALLALSGASANFRVITSRIIVRPDIKLKSGTALWQAGRDYQRQGMWAMAVVHYRAAVGAAPNRPTHYKSLGIGYNKLNRKDRALRALEQALRLDPTDAETAVLVKRLKRDQAASAAPSKAP